MVFVLVSQDSLGVTQGLRRNPMALFIGDGSGVLLITWFPLKAIRTLPSGVTLFVEGTQI